MPKKERTRRIRYRLRVEGLLKETTVFSTWFIMRRKPTAEEAWEFARDLCSRLGLALVRVEGEIDIFSPLGLDFGLWGPDGSLNAIDPEIQRKFLTLGKIPEPQIVAPPARS